MKKILQAAVLWIISVTVSQAQTASWTPVLPALFPTNASGQIHGISRCSQIKFHPTNANKMYAVSARGGLFITTNGGTSWAVTPGTDFTASTRLASVCVDFTDDNIIYLGTGDHNYYYSGNGVLKSLNGGQTFTASGLSGLLVVEMIMDPLDHNTIVAVTNAGIYKTINGGSTWTLKSASRPFDDLKHKAANSRTLYAATTDSAFFRSTNFGDTWTQITSGIILPAGITNGNGCRIALTPADSNVVYLGMVANSGMIYKSTNGGTSFTAKKTAASPYLTYYSNSSTSSGQGDYNFGIGVDRTNANILYLVAHNNWKSTDGGTTWTQLTNWYEKCHTDMHQIVTSPYNNANLYNVNDGGIFLSTDGGNNWTPRSDGIYGYEIYHGVCSPTRKDMFSIGTQDNGELYATSSGWFTNRGGDWGSRCAFDYRANSSMVYYLDNDQRRLVNGSDASYGLPVTSLEDIAFQRSNTNLAFAANQNIYRTTNLTAATPAWTQISSFSKSVMAVHSSYSDANRLYVITNDGTFYASTNALSGSPTFTSSAIPSSVSVAATITTIKSNPNVVYITANSAVYRSADNGATWTNIKYNLPSVNHVRILADEYFSGNELVFVASNNAVYYKTAGATAWTIYSDLLPTRTSIMDMSLFNDSTNNTSLRVSTYGRGMWETPISNLRTMTANFAANNTNPCVGQSITYTDLSTGSVTSRSWSFPGGTPATSTVQNPVVTYNSAGTYNAILTVSNGSSTNSLTRTAYINTAGASLSLAEGFEGSQDPPDGWKNIDNGTVGYQWQKTATAGGFGASANSMIFDNYSWNAVGEKDELIVKRLNLAGYNTARLTFDVAYQVYSGYSDSLRILVSTDCGNTYTAVYSKGGAVLSTSGSGSNNFVPTATQWRTDTVSLNSYTSSNSVLIAFQNINGYGNKLYLDNVNVSATVAANAGADKTICAGSATTIGMAAISGISYSWTPSTGLSSATVSNPVASPTVTTSYILTATNPGSGISKSDTVIVTVNPAPAAIMAAIPAQCVGASPVALSGTPVGGTFSGPGVSGSNFSPAVAGVGTFTLVYTVVNAQGCSDTAQRTVSVTTCCSAPPSKPGAIAQSGTQIKVCPSETRTFSISPAANASTYEWLPPVGGNIISGQGSTAVTVSFTSSFTASSPIKVRAVNACGASSYVSKTVSRNSKPATPSAITGNNYGLCTSTMEAYSVIAVPDVSYNWLTTVPSSASVTSGQGSNAVQITFQPSFTTGSVNVTGSNGCGTSSVKALALKKTPATPVITGPSVFCPGQTYTFSVAPLYGITSYNWTSPAGSVISDGVNSATNALTTAATSVNVTFGNVAGNIKARGVTSCGTGSYKTIAMTLNCTPRLAGRSDNLIMTMVPNPARSTVTISYQSVSDGVANAKIYNELGQVVYESSWDAYSGHNEHVINVSTFAAGVYEVSVSVGKMQYKERLVVE